jgi:hypothetical protein
MLEGGATRIRKVLTLDAPQQDTLEQIERASPRLRRHDDGRHGRGRSDNKASAHLAFEPPIISTRNTARRDGADGPDLVFAAAGTGKTRTLTHRVAWLVWKKASIREHLLLTFTNRAARRNARTRARSSASTSAACGRHVPPRREPPLRRHAACWATGRHTFLDEDDSARL